MACRVLTGTVFKGSKRPTEQADSSDVPGGYHSKHIHISNANSFYVVPNQDQILPLAVIHSGRDTVVAPVATEQGND